MGLKIYNPYTKSQRHTISRDFSEITRTTPEKSLLESQHSSGGRNNEGHTTTRFRGGGVKQAYRVVDFRRDKDGVPAKVAPSANKVEIAKAVKALFGVEVAAVNTMNYAGKAKRQRTAAAGYRSDWKKAVVTLKPGQQLNLI